jgi:hypothetical protein
MWSAIAGWAALAIAYSIEAFIALHGANCAPLGPFGTYIVFELFFSLYYLADFLLLSLPAYFFLRRRQAPVHRGVWTFCGAVIFALSVPVWSYVGADLNTPDMIYCAVLAAIAGSASFYVLSRFKSISHETA